jgi:hypothetical protein
LLYVKELFNIKFYFLMMQIILLTITIIALLAIINISINNNFENIFAQNQNDSETPPPLVEPDKNITIMTMEKYQSNSVLY